MCSTVHFTYRCGCADKVIFKCPLLLHCHQDTHHDHPQEGAGEEDQVEAVANDEDDQQQEILNEPRPETPVAPPVLVTMTTTLDEECQDCVARRQSATAEAKLDGVDDSSSEDQQNQVPRSPPPLTVREEGEATVIVTAAPVETMLPPPPPPPIPLLPIQRRPIPRRPRFQHRRGGFERSGLQEIPLNMV